MIKDEQKYDPKSNKIGGIVTAAIYWRDLIKDILPDGSNGIVIVFDNPCNPSFTYQVRIPRLNLRWNKESLTVFALFSLCYRSMAQVSSI